MAFGDQFSLPNCTAHFSSSKYDLAPDPTFPGSPTMIPRGPAIDFFSVMLFSLAGMAAAALPESLACGSHALSPWWHPLTGEALAALTG